MPTTGRTGARNYRDRRTLTSSSSDSDSSPERLRFKPLSRGPMKRRDSHSRSPHRGYPPRRSHSPRPISRGRGHRGMRPGVRPKLRMSHSSKPGSSPPPMKRSHSPHRSDFSPPRKSSHVETYDRPHGSKRDPQEYASRKHPSKDPPGRKHHRPESPPNRHPPGRDMHGKYRMEDKYRGSGQGNYLPPRESEPPPPSHSKVDMDMRDRDMRMAPDSQPQFSHKDRVQRGRESMPPISSHNPNFRNEKKERSLMRDSDYSRGDNLRHSPDRHGPTLDERFRHSAEKQADARMHFDREELEKITIDIRRSVREPSPTLRRIVNPEEIKVVRRPGEGNRPLFEREEIKKPLVDLREDASFERRISISKREVSGMDDYGVGRKNLMPESSELRNRDFADNSRQTLSDRWQSSSDRRPNVMRSHRDLSEERGHSYKQSTSPVHYRDQDFQSGSMNKNMNRDLSRDLSFERETRLQKPRSMEDERLGDGSRDSMRPFLDDPSDLRYSLSRRKEGSFSDDQIRLSDRERRDSKSSSRWRDPSKSSLDISSGRYRALQARQRSRSPARDREQREQREGSQDRGVDFSQRPDRFKYAPWAEKPEVIPKGPSYYEHDDRGENDLNRRRGRGRILRPRGFRGRIMRGITRGNFRGRTFRGNLNRGRPYFRRGTGGRSSPHQWEHDLFNKMSPGKNDN